MQQYCFLDIHSLCFLICITLGIISKENTAYTQPAYRHSRTDISVSFYGYSSIKIGMHTYLSIYGHHKITAFVIKMEENLLESLCFPT